MPFRLTALRRANSSAFIPVAFVPPIRQMLSSGWYGPSKIFRRSSGERNSINRRGGRSRHLREVRRADLPKGVIRHFAFPVGGRITPSLIRPPITRPLAFCSSASQSQPRARIRAGLVGRRVRGPGMLPRRSFMAVLRAVLR
jgi:hypothetical protein